MPAKTVLLVEDNDSVRELIKVLLETEGYSIVEAANGFQALELAEDAAPDLMILDLMMPGMDGESVLAKLRLNDKLKDVPVLVVSGKYDSLESLRGKIGEKNIFPKPFEPFRMLDRIEELIGFPDSI